MLKSNSNKGKKKQNAGNRSGAGSVGMSAVCRPTKEWSFVPWWQIFDLIYQRSSQLDEAKPNQPAISPSLCMDICRYFPRDTQTTHSISSYSESTHCKIFFYKYPQKTLICNEVAVPSQRGHRERQDKLWEAEGLVSLLPLLPFLRSCWSGLWELWKAERPPPNPWQPAPAGGSPAFAAD